MSEAIECPACGASKMCPDFRISVGGRTIFICAACRATAVDDNEEPASPGKAGIPITDRLAHIRRPEDLLTAEQQQETRDRLSAMAKARRMALPGKQLG